MRNLRKFEGLLALILVLGLAAGAASQTTLGRLSGSVLDSTGAALPGATITITNENTNQTQSTVAGENGGYVIRAGSGRQLQGGVLAPGLQDRLHSTR